MAGRRTLQSADGQKALRLVQNTVEFDRSEDSLERSIAALTRQLVSVRSQGGIDNQRDVINELIDWLASYGLPAYAIRSPRRKEKNSYLGVVCEVGSGLSPFYLLTACLDTAPITLPERWVFSPTSGMITPDDWMYGRGAADSKVAIAIFSHILASIYRYKIPGTLVFLADSDEHTGRFGAVKEVVENTYRGKIQGAYVGYPGANEIKIGARGFLRAVLRFYGTSTHSGSRNRNDDNAILKAAAFCEKIASYRLPEFDSGLFSFGPKMSVTSISGGGRTFSSIPDHCSVRIDIRLTPAFQRPLAKGVIEDIVKQVDANYLGKSTKIDYAPSWPAYQINKNSDVLTALMKSTKEVYGRELTLGVCGPSNVGNYLASHGIDATCGFGVEAAGIHAVDERFYIKSIPGVYNSYLLAVKSLFGLR